MDSKKIMTRVQKNPLFLKDYLLDDLSSCSSNGFKSFPRKAQCCATLRFDKKNKHANFKKMINPPELQKSIPARSAFAAFHGVVMAAVKRLPFAASKKCSILPRSISRRIIKKSTSFWKKKKKSSGKEIGRWRSFDELIKEDCDPLDRSDRLTRIDDGVDGTVKDENDDVLTDSTTGGDGSSATSTHSSSNDDTMNKQWSSEEKKQLSPVSILDCPFDDEDEDEDEDEVSSPFQHRLARMEGTKKKLLQKIQRFESLAQLEPLNLSQRFELQSDSDNESYGSPLPHSSPSVDGSFENFVSDTEEEENKYALDSLLDFGHKIKAEKLVLDFVHEKLGANSDEQRGGSSIEEEVFEEVKDWINGQKPLFLAWEVQKNRQAYINDMEKGGEWKKVDQEKEEVALELENQVFDALMNELWFDIST